MIILSNENVVSLGRAPGKFPPLRCGRPPHVATVFRWARDGVRADDGERVRLETIRVGRTLCTSVEAIQRFCERLSAGPAAGPARAATSTPRVDGGAWDREARARGL